MRRYAATVRKTGRKHITVKVGFNPDREFIIGVLLVNWEFYGKDESDPASTPKTYSQLIAMVKQFLKLNGFRSPYDFGCTDPEVSTAQGWQTAAERIVDSIIPELRGIHDTGNDSGSPRHTVEREAGCVSGRPVVQ